MITGTIKSQVDQVWNAFWSGGISNPLEVIEQITYLLFIKRLDDLHTLRLNQAARTGKPVELMFKPGKDAKGRPFEDYRWSHLKNRSPGEMFTVVSEHVFEYRANDASGPAADRQEFREGFFLWHDALWERINRRNDRQSYQDGLFRVELLTFDEVSVREALLNAVSHRDYRNGGSIFVRQHPQRLEVVSPGGFPPGVTVENLLEAQNPRNRRLATALQRCGLIERSGQGMNLMFEHAIRQGKALPDFSGTSAHEVKLCLRGAVTTPAFVRFLERLGAEKLRSFATDDFLALDHLRRDVALSAPLRARLPGLVQSGAVETIGRGKHILARSLYAALGGKGTYTRKKGLDRATNKALLLQHIRDNAATGSQMKEFLDVLPAVGGRDVIRALLRELRRDGAIHVVGTRKYARWYPAPLGPSGEG